MRNLLILFIACGGFLSSGFYTVDEREVALLTLPSATDGIKEYSTGVHWKLPFYGKLTYVYTNLRNVYLSSNNPYQTLDGQAFNAGINLNWQVTQPIIYLQFLNKNSGKELELQLLTQVSSQLQMIAQGCTDPQTFVLKANQATLMVAESQLGLKLGAIGITNVILQESKPQVQLAKIGSLSPESAYVQAVQIKQQAESAQQAKLQDLAHQDQKFFNYLLNINKYLHSAKTKQDVPALAELYTQ